MTKFMVLGMPLDEVVAKATTAPAKLLGIEESLGTLRKGALADIAVLELRQGQFTLQDAMGKTATSDRLLTPRAVIRGGDLHMSDLRLARRVVRRPQK